MDKENIEEAGKTLRDLARSGSTKACLDVLGCVVGVLDQVHMNLEAVPKNARHTLALARYGVVYTLRIVMKGTAS